VLALLIAAPATTAAALTLDEPSMRPAAGQTATGQRGVLDRTTTTGEVQSPRSISIGFKNGDRPAKVFVRAGQRVHRGQLLARLDDASLRKRLRSAEATLRSAKAQLEKTKQRTTARRRQAQVSSAQALTVRARQIALDERRKAAEADKASVEQRMSRAAQSLAKARAAEQASRAMLQSAVDQARRSLDQVRKAAAADTASFEKQLAQARQNLARAQSSAQASTANFQTAIDQAQQSVDAAKTTQAQNAQSYQAAVDQAQQTLAGAQSTLSSDQDRLASVRSDRDDYREQVDALEVRVDDWQAKVDADKAALDACKASPPSEGCGSREASYDQDVKKLKDVKSSLSAAESNLASAKSNASSLESTLASDQEAVSSAQSSLTNAQQTQSSGLAQDEQNVQAALASRASAQDTAAAGTLESQKSVSSAQQSLDSANGKRRAGLAQDRQSVIDAQHSATRARKQLASGRRDGEQTARSARQALASAKQSWRSTVAKNDESVRNAADSLGSAQRSLSSTLASSTAFADGPTASDLAVAETKVELAKLLVANARDNLVEGSELRAPVAGTVGAVNSGVGEAFPGGGSAGSPPSPFSSLSSRASSGSISLNDLDSLQVKVGFSESDASKIRLGQPATVSLPALPDRKLAAHVISIDSTPTTVNGASTYGVTLALDRTEPDIGPGMTASAELAPEEPDNAARLERLRARLAAEQKIAVEGQTGVVGIATRYLGVPYAWGGGSPTTGFDCSGLVKYVYAQVGVSLPHYAAAQYDYGVPVSRDQLEPGDLVFFDGLGHVGIYIGNGEFIQAPHTGDVVKISSLDEPWYATTYVGARRLETGGRL
jgi:cell wall-associated NlpC family hydrolase